MFENTPTAPTPDIFGPPPAPPPTTPPPQPAAPEVPSQDLHTMPERFFAAGGPAGGGGGGLGKLKVILIIVLGVAVLGVGGYLAYTQFFAPKTNGNANVNAVANANQPKTNGNANRANANANVNKPANANAAANQNLNANLNLNANANLNANVNLNTNQSTNANVNASTSGTPLPSSKDADSDGLTDVEESVLGTSPTSSDTDGDGFVDGKQLKTGGQYAGEVYLGYDPTKAGGKKLADNPNLVAWYQNPTLNYKTLHPAKWLPRASDSTNTTVLFAPDPGTGEFFQIVVADNPQKLSARAWYQTVDPSVPESQIESLTVSGLDGVRSPDKSTVYLVKGDKTYLLTYNSGTLTEVNFRTFFDVFVTNFTLVAAGSTPTNANSNANRNTNAATNANSNANVNASNKNSSLLNSSSNY